MLNKHISSSSSTYIHTYIHTHTHTYTHIHTHIHTLIHTLIHTHPSIRPSVRPYLHTRTQARTRAHTYTHTYIHGFLNWTVSFYIEPLVQHRRHIVGQYRQYTIMKPEWITASRRLNNGAIYVVCITRILIVVITECCISNPIHSVENRHNTSHIFTVTCLKSQTCSPFGGFRNRRNFGQHNDVLLRQLIVRWKDHAIDILLFEKKGCFNIGNGAI